jgi:hypothetical protein
MTSLTNNDNFNLNGNSKGKGKGKGKYNKHVAKQGRSARMRRTNDYWLNETNKERRKQTKDSYMKERKDKHLAAAEEDEVLANLAYANFLGCSILIKDGQMAYNTERAVNLKECDVFLQPEPIIQEPIISDDDCSILDDLPCSYDDSRWYDYNVFSVHDICVQYDEYLELAYGDGDAFYDDSDSDDDEFPRATCEWR